MSFQLVSEYGVKGDQEQAIGKLVRSLEAGNRHQTLLGVTGSGKTFSMASGKNKKGDVCLPSKDLGPALASLKSMIEAAKLKAKGKKLAMWEFRSSPHEQFGRSLDDAFGAFPSAEDSAADAFEAFGPAANAEGEGGADPFADAFPSEASGGSDDFGAFDDDAGGFGDFK